MAHRLRSPSRALGRSRRKASGLRVSNPRFPAIGPPVRVRQKPAEYRSRLVRGRSWRGVTREVAGVAEDRDSERLQENLDRWEGRAKLKLELQLPRTVRGGVGSSAGEREGNAHWWRAISRERPGGSRHPRRGELSFREFRHSGSAAVVMIGRWKCSSGAWRLISATREYGLRAEAPAPPAGGGVGGARARTRTVGDRRVRTCGRGGEPLGGGEL